MSTQVTPQYVPSFPFYDAEPYWHKRPHDSSEGSGDDSSSGLPSFGSLSKIGCIEPGSGGVIVGRTIFPISVAICAGGEEIITGSKNHVASGLRVKLLDDVSKAVIANLVETSDDSFEIESYTDIDRETIEWVKEDELDKRGEFTMPALPENQALIFSLVTTV